MSDAVDYRLSEVDGIRVVSEHIPDVRSISIGIWINIGSRHERDDERGYAHFVEHLLFKGNDRYTAESISEYFDSIGSDANAATTKEYTLVHSRVLDRHIGDVLDVFGSMVLTPGFDVAEIESERQVILEEIAMYDDTPSDVVHELADTLVFPHHELGMPIIGTEEIVGDASAATLSAFHAEHYTPSSIVISAAGNCSHDELVALVRERFLAPHAARWAGATATHAPVERTAPSVEFIARASTSQKESEQVHMVLAAPGISRHDPRRYTAIILDCILGGTPSSRLFVEIRERRGLAYSVYSFVSQYADAGEIGVYVAVRPDRLREALEVLRAELSTFASTTASDESLKRAHDHVEGRMLLSMESTTVRSHRLGAALISGLPIESIATNVERIRAVTSSDVQKLAKELLALERLSVALVAEDPKAAYRHVCDVFECELPLLEFEEAQR